MNCLIFGASSGLGRACAHELAKAGHNLFLISSDARDLHAVATDLKIRYPVQVEFLMLDLVSFNENHLRRTIEDTFGLIDGLFLLEGYKANNEERPLKEKELERLTEINFMAPIKIVNAFRSHLTQSVSGNCVGIGSILAARGHSKSLIYGSCRHGLEYYFEALAQTFENSACKVQFYRLGYLELQDFREHDPWLTKTTVDTVARVIAKGLNKNRIGVFVPRWWRIVDIGFKLLPRFIYQRLRTE